MFAELAKCRQLKRGVFPSVVALQEAATLFVWRAGPRPSSPPPKEQLAELAAVTAGGIGDEEAADEAVPSVDF